MARRLLSCGSMNNTSLYYLAATLDSLPPGPSEARTHIIAIAAAWALEAAMLAAEAAEGTPELDELAECTVSAAAMLQQRAFGDVGCLSLSS